MTVKIDLRCEKTCLCSENVKSDVGFVLSVAENPRIHNLGSNSRHDLDRVFSPWGTPLWTNAKQFLSHCSSTKGYDSADVLNFSRTVSGVESIGTIRFCVRRRECAQTTAWKWLYHLSHDILAAKSWISKLTTIGMFIMFSGVFKVVENDSGG